MNDPRLNGRRSVHVYQVMKNNLVAKGLTSVLESVDSFPLHISGRYNALTELPSRLTFGDSDFVIVSLEPNFDPLPIQQWVALHRTAHLIGISRSHNVKAQKWAQEQGLTACLSIDDSIERFREQLFQVFLGHFEWSKWKSEPLPQEKEAKKQNCFVERHQLTPREIEVMRLISQAWSTKEIAKMLFISAQTVSVHRKNIMRKLGVNNTAAVVRLAIQNQLAWKK